MRIDGSIYSQQAVEQVMRDTSGVERQVATTMVYRQRARNGTGKERRPVMGSYLQLDGTVALSLA